MFNNRKQRKKKEKSYKESIDNLLRDNSMYERMLSDKIREMNIRLDEQSTLYNKDINDLKIKNSKLLSKLNLLWSLLQREWIKINLNIDWYKY